MTDVPAPYGLADIGLLYDALRLYQERPDVPFYVEEATRAGVTVTGVDASPSMLARCRERLAAEPLRGLTAAARHLAPGGRLVFDVFNPSFAAMTADRSAEREDTPETPLPDGRTLRRTARVVRTRWTEQVNEVELIYHVAERPGATPARHVQAFDMRWYVPAELVHLLARAGFRAETVYGGFDRSPLTDASPEQVVCAVRE